MITAKDEMFFSRAFELAQYGEHRVRVGCIATIKSTPIAGTWNTIRNTTISGVPYTAHTNHAEASCINLVPYLRRSSITLYVCRIDSNGYLKPSRPCKHCMKVIRGNRIKEVVFWNDTIQKIGPSSL